MQKWPLSFVLSSHVDPIGEQIDVQYLSTSVNVLCMFGISGTVHTSTRYIVYEIGYYISFVLPLRLIPSWALASDPTILQTAINLYCNLDPFRPKDSVVRWQENSKGPRRDQ